MDTFLTVFNIVAGAASIISLVISLIALGKVTRIEKHLNINQSIKVRDINHSTVKQTGIERYDER